jgi:catechol 2,3-dioxygenase-like lactoylglutathione lyase family enzyme
MSGTGEPVLNQINLVVKDMARTVAFYRRLGLTVEEAARPEWARHHATALLPNGVRLELDSIAFARQWNPGLRRPAGGAGGVIFFGVPMPNDVDRLFEDMTGAGYASQTTPADAFWGARYAIVEDPDGNAVGFMSPIDPARRRAPPHPPEG